MSKASSSKPPIPRENIEPDAMETAKRIMKRLVETPHQPLGVRAKPKERPASKGRGRTGKD